MSDDEGRDWALGRLAEARVARLGTLAPAGVVRLVPISFVVHGGRVFSAVDHKPKTTAALARLADIEREGRATVLVDHYDDDDWSALWWVRASGSAAVHAVGDPLADAALDALAAKYAQYRAARPAGPVYSVAIEAVAWWRAGG